MTTWYVPLYANRAEQPIWKILVSCLWKAEKVEVLALVGVADGKEAGMLVALVKWIFQIFDSRNLFHKN